MELKKDFVDVSLASTMDYIVVPSLEHMAQVHISLAVIKHEEVRCLLRKISTSLTAFERSELENKIIESVSGFSLPEPLKKNMLCSIFSFFDAILKWKKCIYSFQCTQSSCDGDTFLDKLIFTPQGMINGKKTIEALLKDGKWGVGKRYELACIYCLEDLIPLLWEEVENKELYYNDEGEVSQEHNLVLFWTYYIKGEISKLSYMFDRGDHRCTPFQYAFECAACFGNKVALEHFWKKMTPSERNESLMRSVEYLICTSNHCYSYINVPEKCYGQSLLFLFSQMTEKQQIEVFKHATNYPLEALVCLLDVPWHYFIIQTLNCISNFLDWIDYECFLRNITRKFSYYSMNCSYKKLFGEVWQLIPFACKMQLIDRIRTENIFIPNFLQFADKENLGLILSYATTADKEAIILSHEGKLVWSSLVRYRNYDYVKFLIEMCIQSEEAMTNLSHLIKRRISEWGDEQSKDYLLKKFCQVLSDITETREKRGIEKECCDKPAKKVCRSDID